jgi:hypothetical protein
MPPINTASCSCTPCEQIIITAGDHHDTTGRLDQRIRKAVEFVRQDITAAGDVRSMNRRLQVMLEETLMKNLHLQNVGCISAVFQT